MGGEREKPEDVEYRKDAAGQYILDTNGRRIPRQGEYEPPSVLSNRDAINEDNWAEHERQGFVAVDPYVSDDQLEELLGFRQAMFGADNVFTGQPYDAEVGKPTYRDGGKGIYTNPAGMARWEELDAYRREREVDTGSDSESQ